MKRTYKIISLTAFSLCAGSMGQIVAADTATSCVAPTAMKVQELFAKNKIDAAHQTMFNSMDCEGQNLALKMIEQTCKGENTCKGLNSCKTTEHDCAGQGSCKGTTKGPFTDKNQAIELAQKHMAEKRMSMMK